MIIYLLGVVRHSKQPHFPNTGNTCLCVCRRLFFQSGIEGKQGAAATVGLVEACVAINMLTVCV